MDVGWLFGRGSGGGCRGVRTERSWVSPYLLWYQHVHSRVASIQLAYNGVVRSRKAMGRGRTIFRARPRGTIYLNLHPSQYHLFLLQLLQREQCEIARDTSFGCPVCTDVQWYSQAVNPPLALHQGDRPRQGGYTRKYIEAAR